MPKKSKTSSKKKASEEKKIEKKKELKKEMKVNYSYVAIGLFVASILISIFGIYNNALGKDLGTTKVVEFTSTGMTTGDVFDTINKIDSTAELEPMEDLRYRAYFDRGIDSEYIKNELSPKLNNTEVVVSESIGISAASYYSRYMITLMLGVLVMFLFAVSPKNSIPREFRLKVALASIFSILYQIALVSGAAFVMAIAGLYNLNFWTLSLIEIFSLMIFIMKLMELYFLTRDETEIQSVKHIDIFQEYLKKKNKNLEFYLVGLGILFTSIYIVTAAPFYFAVLVIVSAIIVIYYNEYYIYNLIFTTINNLFSRTDFFKNSKFWQK